MYVVKCRWLNFFSKVSGSMEHLEEQDKNVCIRSSEWIYMSQKSGLLTKMEKWTLWKMKFEIHIVQEQNLEWARVKEVSDCEYWDRTAF